MGEHKGAQALNVTGSFKPEKVRFYREMLSDVFGPDYDWTGKRWLDIGCGHGELLKAVEKLSQGAAHPVGVEPNEQKQAMARARGLTVSFFDLNTHEERYDVISMLNVFSHLPDPGAAIQGWRRLLRSGGQLLLETGDTANFVAAEHYRPFYLPDHLSFANEAIVVNLVTRAGFDVEKVCKYPFIRPTPRTIIRETAKLAIPSKRSIWRYLLKWRRYAATDMFIRAKARASGDGRDAATETGARRV
jgi:SAM-dependent methyltransferase